ncbi:MAG TPA: MBL fold metallo-hydrolase [Epulopiscium sp.]|nr:MBL fold metallo-hydrolase [Candidatus Epulonipiscium sp.]
MIDKIVVGPLQENAYFIIDEDTKKGFLIDPGAEAGRILEMIKENNWEIGLILITHGHYDHIGAAKEIREVLGCEIVAHKGAKEYLEDPEINLSTAFGDGKVKLKADHYINEDEPNYDEFTKDLPDTLSFKVSYVPGHTTDSILFYFEHYNAAFVGDVIFKESVGRSDLRGGNGATLLESIRTHVFTLPEETVLYPGHGPSTTVKYEKSYNPYFNMGY